MSENVTYDTSKKGLSIASLVLGILGLVFFWFPLVGIICSILGLIFGIVAAAKKRGIKGLNIAGIILSAIALVILIIIVAVGAAAVAAGFAMAGM